MSCARRTYVLYIRQRKISSLNLTATIIDDFCACYLFGKLDIEFEMDERDDSYLIAELTADLSLHDLNDTSNLEPTACSCNGACWYKTGKRMCPCKSLGFSCTRNCSCGKRRACKNREPESSTVSTFFLLLDLD